jgi:protein phosphatase
MESEDFSSCGNPRARWVIVADGVGSAGLGAVASRMVVDEFDWYAMSDAIKRENFSIWLRRTDSMINEALAEQTKAAGTATFAAALANSRFGKVWTILWVGDCRAYVHPDGKSIEQLTRDQTYAAIGEKPPPHAWPNDPAFMVGCDASSHYGSAQATIRLGDTLLVCTDGVHRFVETERMASILQGSRDLRQACREIIREAASARDYDDATIAAVRWHRWFGAAGQYWLCLTVGVIFLGVMTFS